MPFLDPESPASLVRRVGLNPSAAGRDLLVGDVHGCFSKLRAALEAVGFDPAAGDRLFSVGDLVDRGPESADALWWLDQPWFFAVRGNHEDMAIRWAQPGCEMDARLYAANGGAWNIAQTQPERLRFADAFAALPVALELETPAGLLGLVHADCPGWDWAAFVHALTLPELPRSHRKALIEAALWSRDRAEALSADLVAGVVAVVVGHTPVERVTSLGNVVFIDCGAWLQGGKTERPFVVLDAATLTPATKPARG